MSTFWKKSRGTTCATERGFSLLEVLVSFALVSVALVVTINFFVTLLEQRPSQQRAQELTRAVSAVLEDMTREARVSSLVERKLVLESSYNFVELHFHRKDGVNLQSGRTTVYRWRFQLPRDLVKITDYGTAEAKTWTMLPANVRLDKFYGDILYYQHPITKRTSSALRLRALGVHTEAAPDETDLLIQTTFALRTI